MQVTSQPNRSRSSWAAAARLGQAHWFLGNLYEAMVDMPGLLADARAQRVPGLLAPGSPLRYYIPAAPLTFTATTAALIDSWHAGGDKRVIITAAASTAAATALTAYLVRSVNLRLLQGGEPLGALERRRLVTTWHRGNLVRLVALAVASIAVRQTSLPASPNEPPT